ncbi:MAG: phosphatidylglycerophosphatase A [Methanosphaera sp.]|nr:phosphatidylglycerophosphatase A [Methanosphaera sp.]
MDLNMEGITAYTKVNGLIVESEEPLYILSNRSGYDFKYSRGFDSHYLNDDTLERVVISEDGITVISSVEYLSDKFFTNISILFDTELDNISLLNIYRTVTESITSTSWNNDAINKDELDNMVGNYYNTIFIACRSKADHEIPFDITLYYQTKELVNKAITKSLDMLGYPRDIIKYMEDMGITLDAMEDAAMELVVGVDEPEEETRKKFRKTLLHALDDINVISYLVAALRLEEDYEHHRIRGVNVDDDPAYLYMDEIMGMAIANQIAGTKAIFNFKIYDQNKPGILGVLGPSADDIIGGLIAGCMSKIFEP